MPKFYTGLGDNGETSIGSRKLTKDNELVCAIGDIDELNSSLGLAASNMDDEHAIDVIHGVQNGLFIMGAQMASSSSKTLALKRKIDKRMIMELESEIGEFGSKVGKLDRFVIPGGSVGAAHLQSCRAIARRAERSVVAAGRKSKLDKELLAYINRLSSLLFVMALYMNKKEGIGETNPPY